MRTFFPILFIFLSLNFLCSCTNEPSQQKNLQEETLLTKTPFDFETFLKSIDDSIVQKVISDPEYKCQIIYTQIDRDSLNVPYFTFYYYHLDTLRYLNPASLVKLPTALMGLEKLNNLNVEGLDKFSVMYTDSSSECQHTIRKDTSSPNKLPTIAHYIKRMMLVSENDPYSRLYEFLGQQYIYERLQKAGYTQARIVHRFDPACNTEQNKNTNQIEFDTPSGQKIIYTQEAAENTTAPTPPLGIVKVGKGYIDHHNKLVNEPKDFTYSNIFNLCDIQLVLSSLLFPENVPSHKQFNITRDDREFMIKHMALLPREVTYPRYNAKDFPDNIKKYWLYGNTKNIESDSVRIMNVVGQSYGFMSDVAYIMNAEQKIEFMLSAVVYVNKDEIINDGKYEYESLALPFFSELGNMIYQYELQRTKKYKPDLRTFNDIINKPE